MGAYVGLFALAWLVLETASHQDAPLIIMTFVIPFGAVAVYALAWVCVLFQGLAALGGRMLAWAVTPPTGSSPSALSGAPEQRTL